MTRDSLPMGPVSAGERSTALDAIRGIATLGILPMNAVTFGLTAAAYDNISADGIRQPLDWIVGVFTMIFVDQKMMALFAMLFGVSTVVFADRAKARGRRIVWLSLWRFVLLLGIGIAHSRLWEGDILVLYALCAPLVLLARKLPVVVLITTGITLSLAGSFSAPVFQSRAGSDPSRLGEYWFADGEESSAAVLGWLYLDSAGRALGFMLVGVALYRLGIAQGQRGDSYYRRMMWWGLGAGTAITTMGIVLRIVSDWSPSYALIGQVPTGVATMPMALGYMALIIQWNRAGGRHSQHFRQVGRMALTNYLTQTILGVAMLTWWWGDANLSRTMIGGWILGVWALQLWWSTWWLTRFRHGPFEWAWRCATYRSWQPRRTTTP